MKNWKRTVVNVLKWLFVTAYFVVILSFVHEKSDDLVCTSLNVDIVDSLQTAFIIKNDVVKTIKKQNDTPIGKPLKDINTHELEQRFKNQHAIKDIAIYKTYNGALNVRIKQRKPMVRIINKHNRGYYIDEDGQIMPLSRNYTSHVLIVNGNITEPFEIAPNINIRELGETPDSVESPFIYKLYEMARYITDDSFWNAQITQVYVDSRNDIELIPRIGSHIILIGGPNDIEKKLSKLKVFYERALPAEGWNKYKTINLKYKNQIVCTKR